MQIYEFTLNITSEDPDRLAAFYRDVLLLTPDPNIGKHGFVISFGTRLRISHHSEVKGKAKEPQRMLINFFIDDLAAEQTRLEEAGVEFIRKAGREKWGGIISTFLDPDGNYLQLIEHDETKRRVQSIRATLEQRISPEAISLAMSWDDMSDIIGGMEGDQ